jgi:AAA family ATP:ADP antiporter
VSLNPLKSFLDVKRREAPFVALMFGYFLLVISVFWILKPIKKALFLAHYRGGEMFSLFGWQLGGPEAEQLAKVANMVVAFVATVVFSLLARRLRRQQLTVVFAGFSLLSLLSFFAILHTGSEAGVWSFYLFGDLFNTLMVPTFFAFLNDSVAPADSKRLYGPIVLGGVVGGAFGSLVVAVNYKALSVEAWLGICSGLVVLIAVIATAAGRLVDRVLAPAAAVPETPAPVASRSVNPAIEGARLVMRSRYLMSIFAIVALYEIMSTVADYQFTSTVNALVPTAGMTKEAADAAVGQHLSTVFLITNTVGLIVQLFLTPVIMSKLSVRAALLIMPVAILSNSAAFLLLPALWIGSLLNTTDNGLHYSINQSARESLYTPTSRDEKYKAKAFIDMFVQRAGKAVAVGLNLALFAFFGDFSGVRWLSLFVIALVGVWLLAASYAGRRFRELTGEAGPPSKPSRSGGRRKSGREQAVTTSGAFPKPARFVPLVKGHSVG